MIEDVVTTWLELAAVLLLAVGAGLMAAAMVGGLLGAGVGLVSAAVVLSGASAILRALVRPSAAAMARRHR